MGSFLAFQGLGQYNPENSVYRVQDSLPHAMSAHKHAMALLGFIPRDIRVHSPPVACPGKQVLSFLLHTRGTSLQLSPQMIYKADFHEEAVCLLTGLRNLGEKHGTEKRILTAQKLHFSILQNPLSLLVSSPLGPQDHLKASSKRHKKLSYAGTYPPILTRLYQSDNPRIGEREHSKEDWKRKTVDQKAVSKSHITKPNPHNESFPKCISSPSLSLSRQGCEPKTKASYQNRN